MANTRWAHRQGGQSMTEFIIVFPLLVLLVFGIIQFALLYQARATLNHATMLAARAGALHNGNKTKMREALGAGLAPLFASSASMPGHANAVRLARRETASNLTTVNVINPTRAVFSDFARPRLDGGSGRALPNDTLNYRNPAPGSASRISVQDANILHVRVTYCVRLIVPVLDRVIHAAVNASSSDAPVLSANGMKDPFGTGLAARTRSCSSSQFRGIRIPISSEAFVRMQSPFYESNL